MCDIHEVYYADITALVRQANCALFFPVIIYLFIILYYQTVLNKYYFLAIHFTNPCLGVHTLHW